MPLPFPEALQSKSRREDGRSALKKGVVAVVIVLNFLHLGRPHDASGLAQVGRKLNRRQWKAVQHFEQLLQAWTTHEPVTPSVMGRTAGKVESLEAILRSLEEQAEDLLKQHSGYFCNSLPQFDQIGVPPAERAKLGSMTADSLSTFKPVQASRLNFVGIPRFDPSPYLDPLGKKIFNNPLEMRMPASDCHVRPPKLKVHCSHNEKIKLFELLDASSRLSIHQSWEVTPRFGNGLFAVTKNLERDRLILDARGANLLEAPPRRWIKSLASAESLTKIYLSESEDLACSGNDLTDFYYLFKASPARAQRNVLVGPLHPKEISHLKAVKAEHLDQKIVYGSLSSLAMGDCQAVELAQSCHLGLGLQHDIIEADNLVTMYRPLPREKTMIGLVIDDLVAISKISKDANTDELPSPGAKLSDKMQDAYEEVGLIPNKKKSFRDERDCTFWGVDIEGSSGLLRGSLRRAIPLAGIILQLVKIGACCADLMQVMTGSLISLFLFRRRLLSLMDSLFRQLQRA